MFVEPCSRSVGKHRIAFLDWMVWVIGVWLIGQMLLPEPNAALKQGPAGNIMITIRWSDDALAQSIPYFIKVGYKS